MRAKSSLFLTEQLIVIAIFAICAAVCVRIFVESYIISNAGADITNALLVAKNGAESFKAASGDMDVTTEVFGTNLFRQDGLLFAYYDSAWRPCVQGDALYELRLEPYDGAENEASLVFCRISVVRLGDGALSGTIVESTAAARKSERN